MPTIKTYQHSFDLPLQKTALLIVDMQNDFCHPNGFSGSKLKLDLAEIRSIIPSLQTLLKWARESNLEIIFTRETHLPDLSDLTSSKRQRYVNAGSPIGAPGPMGRFLVQGETGSEIIDELQPLPNEILLNKPAHSCFVGTSLDLQLRDRHISHLLITGVTTECCVLATYRHASDLGYYCLLLEDCCAAFNRTDHEATLHILQAEGGVLGWVAPSSVLYHTAVPQLD